jgi:hypothetical protein
MERKPCKAAGCTNLASRYPKILIWAKLDLRHEFGAIELLLPEPRCREHQADFDPQAMFIEATRRRIRDAMAAMRKAEPDFDSMEVEWVRIGDSLWRALADGGRKPH